ncbi:MAG: VWA domain-containing protein [Bacteroidetes bacterium]|nr:VWA domain-containing protein [Bacteroidota bacterium]
MKTTINRAGIALALVLGACGNPSHENAKEEQVNYVAPAMCEMAPPPPPQNTEEYSNIKEAGFQSALRNPYSTFSIDVDAASYSLMRRMINEGVLPPSHSVRVEEWINYLNYSYVEPGKDEVFSVNTEYSECAWNKNHKLLQIGLRGYSSKGVGAKANNLVFLIDASGSMEEPDKLPLLKRAFKLLVPQLRAEDKISIVTYAGSAGVVLDAVSGNKKGEILEALERLEAGGSTAGGEGINLAYKIAAEHFIKEGNNRVILATDGDFNVGVSNEAELEKLIESKRSEGVYLSVLGFGEGNIKDNKMELLADKGNGNYNYIDNFLEARKVLVKQFGGTLNTIAKDVKLQVEFNPAYVKEYRLIGYENRTLNQEDFNNDKKDAGELGAEHCVTALYEIVTVDSKESNSSVDDLKYQETKRALIKNNELVNIKFRYKEPGKNDTVSKLIQHPVLANVIPVESVSGNFKLACAVSEFALLMRDSDFKGSASFDHAIGLAGEARKNDEEGYVEELLRLIKAAKGLKETH